MRTDNKHIDQSSEHSALTSEVSDLKAMMSTMQEIMMHEVKRSQICIKMFNNHFKSKTEKLEEKKEGM